MYSKARLQDSGVRKPTPKNTPTRPYVIGGYGSRASKVHAESAPLVYSAPRLTYKERQELMLLIMFAVAAAAAFLAYLFLV